MSDDSFNSVAWNNPGHFEIQYDSQGRPTHVEGWLSHRPGERSAADKAVQKKFGKEHQLSSTQDAFHVFAHEHGGPTARQHGGQVTSAGLVAGDRRMNRSYHRATEKVITRDLQAGKPIYAKAEIIYSDRGGPREAERVRYTYYIKDAQGQRQFHSSSMLRTNPEKTSQIKSMTHSQVYKQPIAKQSLKMKH
jgi:hypothetical protein